MMPRLPAFLAANPDLDLLLNPTYDVVELAPGGVDVAIRYGHGGWPGLVSELLMPSDFMIVGAPSLVADRRVAAAADLLDLPWIVETGANELTRWLAEQGVVEGPRRAVTQVPNHAMLEAVRAGIGISPMARPAALAEISAGRLVEIFAPPEGGALADDRAGYWIVTRPGVMRPPLKAFVSWLRAQV